MAVGFGYQIYYRELAGEFRSRGQGGRWINMVGKQMLILSKNQAPSRSGKLRRSHGKSRGRVGVGFGNQYTQVYHIYADAPHAEYVHEGTHSPITAKGGGRMRLPAGGGYGVLYRKSVRGQKANPWLDRACTTIAIRYGGTPVG